MIANNYITHYPPKRGRIRRKVSWLVALAVTGIILGGLAFTHSAFSLAYYDNAPNILRNGKILDTYGIKNGFRSLVIYDETVYICETLLGELVSLNIQCFDRN